MCTDTNEARWSNGCYRARNWSAYAAGLINLGNATMWVAKAELEGAPDAAPMRGRPRIYSDIVI
ncbi:transposase [Burkholderia pseudomallei 1710a]|uniref:Transposase n=1 Tax=Burkholderia pseudomallei 1710a TaxID=320371 RepID=A0A0E1VYM4_BURPE|nr:transposase [Burkholderia pseudomallei 1710a]